jgi:hypothetical protein
MISLTEKKVPRHILMLMGLIENRPDLENNLLENNVFFDRLYQNRKNRIILYDDKEIIKKIKSMNEDEGDKNEQNSISK